MTEKKTYNQGEKNGMWKGDKASITSARERARRILSNTPEGTEIHHMDGNPYNNNLENLCVISRKNHMLLDGKMPKFIAAKGGRWIKGQSGNPNGRRKQ